MATALDSPSVKPEVIATLSQAKPALISVVSPKPPDEMPAEDAEARLDWVFIRVCIACGLLLAGTQIYEFIRWMLG